MARMSPDDVRDAVLYARDLVALADEGLQLDHATLISYTEQLGAIRRTQPRSPLTEEAARLEDRLHALI